MIDLLTPDDDERGQVGIGTLIVFIAMVLVAAIAAGVLINTAGFLQTQAENTGTESTEQVSNNINVLGSVGEVAADNSSLDELRLVVAPAAGSQDVNLKELTIQYVSDEDYANLVHTAAEDTRPSDAVFNTSAITAEDRSDNVMTDSSDRYQLTVYLNDSLNGNGSSGVNTTGDNTALSTLSPGEEVEMTLTTEAGAQVVATVQVPDSLAGESANDTVTV
ncbi:flagellin [Salinarchaeum chitinilyticum]